MRLSPTNAAAWGSRAARRSMLLAVATFLAGFAGATPAHAGTYLLWTCQSPSATSFTGSNGWTFSQNVGSTPHRGEISDENCGTVNFPADMWIGLANLNASIPAGTFVTKTFTATAGLTIGDVTLQATYAASSQGDDGGADTRAVFFRNGTTYDAAHIAFTCAAGAGCSGGTGPIGFTATGDQKTIAYQVGCYGPPGGSCGGPDRSSSATINVPRGVITLIDSSPPTAKSVSGGLVAGGPVSGTQGVTVAAADAGSGLYSASAAIDGASIGATSPLDVNGDPQYAIRTCVPVGVSGNLNAFAYETPCKTSLSTGFSVDTTAFADGVHTLSVTLGDASGNSAVVYSKQITILNHPVAADPGSVGGGAGGSTQLGTTQLGTTPAATTPAGTTPGAGSVAGLDGSTGSGLNQSVGRPNGSGGDLSTVRFTGASAKKPKTVTATYGAPTKVGGRLLDAKSKPITGAIVNVTVGDGVVATVRTDAKGRFTYALAAVAADTVVTFTFAPRVGNAATVTQAVTVHVHAGVTLRIGRSAAKLGEKVVFSGTVTAGALPNGGARVVIESYQQGRWVIAALPRTNAAGAYSWTHRFRHRGAYRMRARLLATDGLSVRSGKSATKRVRIS